MFGDHGESVNRFPARQRIWIVAALVGGLLFGWQEKGGGSCMTKKIIGLALACFLAGWLFGSNPASPGASSTGRWVMTGPANAFLLNTRTGDIWKFYPAFSI